MIPHVTDHAIRRLRNLMPVIVTDMGVLAVAACAPADAQRFARRLSTSGGH
jgi:hypothetical protein